MLKTLKNYQILDLMEAFTKIGKTKFTSNKRFSYALILNEETLLPKVKALMEISKPSDSYEEYETKRNEIVSKYAETDSDGNIILKDNRWVVFKPDVKDDALNELKELDDANSDILEERQKDINDYNDILNTDVELVIETLSLDDIPDELGEDIFLIKQLMGMID